MKSTSLCLATIKRLTTLSENDLQRLVVEPLLRSQGFTNVRQTSGPNDKGKDLIATKEDFGKAKLYAIQIKKFTFSGKHNKSNGLSNVVTQLKQLFSEPVKDPLTNNERLADRCLFITPYEIHRDALESAFREVVDLERKEITIIDGPILVDMITKQLPSVLTYFDIDLQYQYRLSEEVNHIPESSAFGVSRPLTLKKLYVDIQLADNGRLISSVAKSNPIAHAKFVSEPPQLFVELEEQCTRWSREHQVFPDIANKVGASTKPRGNKPGLDGVDELQREHETLLKARRQKLSIAKSNLRVRRIALGSPNTLNSNTLNDDGHIGDLENEIIRLTLEEVRYVDIAPILVMVRNAAAALLPLIEELGTANMSAERCTALFQILTPEFERIESFVKLPILKHWSGIWKTDSDSESVSLSFDATSLLKIQMPVFVRGGAGSGKSTLLRHLCQQHLWSREDESTQIPILIRLALLQIESIGDLIEVCYKQLHSRGHGITRASFEARLRSGGFRIYFDGLDELGPKLEIVFAILKDFAKTFPKSAPIVTGRDTYEYSKWPAAVQFQVLPFSPQGLSTFVGRWFTSEPSNVSKVLSWFSSNRSMEIAACTPINASLFCSLVEADADLPGTEVELYEQRFELLLGRWERAKGFSTLTPSLRRRYWHFIASSAYEMHLNASRTIQHKQAKLNAAAFVDGRYLISADNLLIDCVHRGLLVSEPEGVYSFGHLTYQEFLVAKHLMMDNPIDFIATRLEEPWWLRAFEFYSALKGDVTSLILRALLKQRSSAYLRRLLRICDCAPLTPIEARQRVLLAYSVAPS